jgi:flagellar biosynthesis/type III secretory pathway M-ring protein FliF/YscJ
MTTPQEQRRDKWKIVGIFLCFAAFLGMVVFTILADTSNRNANRDTLERMELENKKILERMDAEHKKTRDALWNLYLYEKTQFNAIQENLKRMEKKKPPPPF